jgi:galactokinase/mevalonate kinase-like predicted kinase
MFLGRFETLQTLETIRDNANRLFLAVQHADRRAFERCIARSWTLNKELDSAKLLGAGGGGYMLFCAENAASGAQIRANLEKNPPNSRARFIDFEVADRGIEVTVS